MRVGSELKDMSGLGRMLSLTVHDENVTAEEDQETEVNRCLRIYSDPDFPKISVLLQIFFFSS